MNRRYNIFLLENNSATVSIIRDLLILLLLPINKQNWIAFCLLQYIRSNYRYINRNAISYIRLKVKYSVNCLFVLVNDVVGPKRMYVDGSILYAKRSEFISVSSTSNSPKLFKILYTAII